VKTTWVTIAIFEEEEAGKSFEAWLKEQRIDARTYFDKALQRFLFLCPPRATYRVQVRDKIHKMTQELLTHESPPPLQKALHCPECGSIRVNYPQMTRKFLLPTLFLHLGIIFRIIKHQAYCEACHYMWSLPEHPKPAVQQPAPNH